jgi:hypothetical protein
MSLFYTIRQDTQVHTAAIQHRRVTKPGPQLPDDTIRLIVVAPQLDEQSDCLRQDGGAHVCTTPDLQVESRKCSTCLGD